MIRRASPKLFREPRHWGGRDRQVLTITAFSVVLWMALLYLTNFGDAQSSSAVRYGAAIPVSIAAYFYGLGAGMAVAFFFSTAVWAQTYASLISGGFTLVSAEQVAVTLLLFVIAYVVADLSGSLQSQAALALAVRDREALLSRASNLSRVIDFILRQAKQALEADAAWIILANPLNGMWEIMGGESRLPVTEHDDGSIPLARWLVQHDDPVFLQDLDTDDSFLMPDGNLKAGLRSLISRPMRHSDGSMLGCLVVINTRGENFTASDLQAVDDLVKAGQKALEQAGMYARTDYALEQRVTQLAAIQRTTRELNSTFDVSRIIDITLNCAIEITSAEAGTIVLDIDDLLEMLRVRAEEAANPTPHQALEAALRGGQTPVIKYEEFYLPPFFPRTQSQLLALIQRREQTLGAIVVESPKSQAFDETAGWALSLLADHAAIAMENSRLFHEVRKSQQRTAQLIDSIADGLISTDWGGSIGSVNPAAEELTGWRQSELVGQPLNAVFQPVEDAGANPLDKLLAFLRVIPSTATEKLVLRQRLGTRLVISFSVAPVIGDDERPTGLVILFRDITQKEELDRLQQEMIAAISHEMRTPLTKISTISESIQMQLEHKLSAKQQEHLEIMVAESQRLAKFLDRVLNVHYLESARFRFQIRPVPVSVVIDDILNHWRKAAPDYRFILTNPVRPPLWVWADEDSLILILNNLVDNAVKYSPTGTRIELGATVTEGDQAEFHVRDFGKGIPPEFQSRIFERFYRVDGGDAQVVYGHGLGLYISRMLVGAMGGRMWVDSSPGFGSRFAFTLPLVRADEGISEEESIESQNPGD